MKCKVKLLLIHFLLLGLVGCSCSLSKNNNNNNSSNTSQISSSDNEPEPNLPNEPEPNLPNEPEPNLPNEPEPNLPNEPEPNLPNEPEPNLPNEPEPGLPSEPTPINDEFDLVIVDDGLAISNIKVDENIDTVEIPTEIDGVPVVEIAENAFANSDSIVSISIPNTVKKIGKGAFADCDNLETISLPFVGGSTDENQFIGYIFGADSYLQNAEVMPSSLTVIDLSQVEPQIAPMSLSMRTSISQNSNAWTRVYNYSFYNSTAQRIILPDTIVEIGDYAFYGSKLVDINLPNNITSIGEYAFANCINLHEIVLNNNQPAVLGNKAFDNSNNLRL